MGTLNTAKSGGNTMTVSRRQTAQSLIGASALGAFGAHMTAYTQSTPELVKVLFGFPPGGTTDALLGIVGADKLRGQGTRNVIADDQPGAGGQLATTALNTTALKNASPDSTALLLTPCSMLS
ncbi:MAG: hypothetical protein WEK74_05925, partial [Hydrogenophaga sp.]